MYFFLCCLFFFSVLSAPDPSTVRPVRVLAKTLEMLLKKWEARTDEV